MEKLAAYGYDAISANNDAIPEGLDKEGLKKDIMHEKYAPKIIKADITNVVFEEKPDIVTAVNALFWTRDPLQVFANTARQLKIGGVLCFNNMRNLHTDDIIVTNLFQKIIRYNQGLPGFKIIPTFDNSIVARKVSEQEDYTYGFRLRSRHQCIKEEPFRYTYISDLSSRGRKLEF